MQEYLNENQKLWDAWASFHPNTAMYDLEGFLAGRNSLMPIELEALGDVRGKRLLHLQCHFGQDTLSWSRLGARATGVDFSAKAIGIARQLNDEMGLDAEFIQSNVLELAGKLEGQFDIVFTSYGVITWLPTLRPWAAAISHYLKPGGTFFMAEFHPALMMFDFERGNLAYPYFFRPEPLTEEAVGSYADPLEGTARREHSWQHTLSDIIMALADEGLLLREFREYEYSPFDCWPNMEETAPGQYQIRHLKGVPHLFSLKMSRG